MLFWNVLWSTVLIDTLTPVLAVAWSVSALNAPFGAASE